METWRPEDLETWRHGELETSRVGDLETLRGGELETWRLGELETWSPGKLESWRVGEHETWRAGDFEQGFLSQDSSARNLQKNLFGVTAGIIQKTNTALSMPVRCSGLPKKMPPVVIQQKRIY